MKIVFIKVLGLIYKNKTVLKMIMNILGFYI